MLICCVGLCGAPPPSCWEVMEEINSDYQVSGPLGSRPLVFSLHLGPNEESKHRSCCSLFEDNCS